MRRPARRRPSVVSRRSSVRRAHPSQRAALAIQAVRGALTRVDNETPRARPILARASRQAVVDALLDDERVEVAVEIGDWRLGIGGREYESGKRQAISGNI